jgi:hypothetical protein
MPPHNQRTTSHIGKISIEAANSFWDKVSPEIEWARCMSYAAQRLNMALHDVSQNSPIVMEYDKTMGFPVQTEIARNVCIELLTYATGWGNRRQNSICDHFRDSINLGDIALLKPIEEGVSDGLAEELKIIRLNNIGFNRSELITFLNRQRIRHSLQEKFLEFPEAWASLALRLTDQPSQEEFCMWIFEGIENGGMQAFVNNEDTDELTKFPSTAWQPNTKLKDCVNDLRKLFFKSEHIQEFIPKTRYITGKDLFNRWAFSVGIVKTEQLLKDYLCSAWDVPVDERNTPYLVGFNPGISLATPNENTRPELNPESLFSLTAITEIEKRESILLDLNEATLDFDFYLNLTIQPEAWTDWLNELWLCVDDAKDIEKLRCKDNQTAIGSLNAAAQLAALDCKAKKYVENIDNIIKSNLPQPDLFENRVKIFVWRFIIKKSFFSNPDNPFQCERNQIFQAKLDAIDQLLNPELQIEALTDDGAAEKNETKSKSDNELQQYFKLEIDGDSFVNRSQIKIIFDKLNVTQWRGNFGRETINDLDKSRQGEKGKPIYALNGICKWLIEKTYYKPAEINEALKKYNESKPYNHAIPTTKPNVEPADKKLKTALNRTIAEAKK